MIFRQKVVSKLLRTVGSRGNFFTFSRERLETIAEEVALHCSPNARLDFFHGFTPWILTKQTRPFVAWSDCIFPDYIDIFHASSSFSTSDLERIIDAEMSWLKRAKWLGFSSKWAADRAISLYGLNPHKVSVVGIFGGFEAPKSDAYEGAKQFAFISTNFEAKGGYVVLEAIRRLRSRHPDASLVIVGDTPTKLQEEPGLTLAGFLRKEAPNENERLRTIFAKSRAIVNASRSDTAPVLLIEAGYFGCPTITTRSFAIPELVDDRITGILLESSADPAPIAEAMSWMLESEPEYYKMRTAAWQKAHVEHSREAFELRMGSCIRRFLE
jgi:glycosyltransferase involved in cell wall biosynthesis